MSANDDPELLSFLENEESRARMYDLSAERAVALDFYNGQPFGDEEEGRSQLVTRDVAETVDYMTISILRTMVSGDKVVEFEATCEEDKQACDEATHAIGQQFMAEQDGYSVLHDFLKAGLLEKTGVVKSYAEPQPPKRHEGIVPVEHMDSDDKGNMTVGPHKVVAATPMDEMGAQYHVVLHEERSPDFCDVAVPNEEALIAADARDPDKSIYVAHRVRKTLSELTEMGFDEEEIEELEAGAFEDNQVSLSRDANTAATLASDDRTGPNRKVWLLEEYVRYDRDGDGITELLCVHRVGHHILNVQEVEEQPFTIWCPMPMQHRLIGQSLADKVMDIQRTRSVILRQAMDNLYLSNSPRTLVNEDNMGANTIDDLLTVRPGGIVRWKGALKPEPYAVPFVADKAFDALQFMMDERENRTGITKMNQGLDSDAINKTATGMAMQQAQNQQMEEYLARNFANAVGKMFAKKYRMMRRLGKPFSIQVDGQFKQVDPSKWPEQVRVAVRVGLGSGNKDARMQHRMTLLSIQEKVLSSGMPLITPKKFYNSIAALIQDANLGNPSEYIVDPDSPEGQKIQQERSQQQPPPDPKMLTAQAQIQKTQADIADGQAKTQIHAAKVQAETQHKGAQLQWDTQAQSAALALQQEKDAAQIEIERQRAAAEIQVALIQTHQDGQIAQEKLHIDQQLADQKQAHVQSQIEVNKSKKFRSGGSLDK